MLGSLVGEQAGNLVGRGVGALARTAPGLAVTNNAVIPAFNFLRNAPGVKRMFANSSNLSPLASAPKPSAADDLLAKAIGDPAKVSQTIGDAQKLGAPFTLADASTPLTGLAGQVVRRSPDAAAIAENALLPRANGQYDRLRAGLTNDLGPISNVPQRSIDLAKQAKADAAPLWNDFYASPAVGSPEMDSWLKTPFARDALSRAKTIAANERRDPTQLGFSLDANGNVNLNPVQGDLYGAQAQARSAFSDAQQSYKEALRKPGADVNAARQALIDARDAMTKADGALATSPSPGTAATSRQYSPQTVDYVKRGMDDVLEDKRNPITGKLVLDEAGRAQNDVRQGFLSEADKLFPAWPAARQAYGGPMQSRDALALGRDSTTLDPNDLAIQVAGKSPEQLAQMQLGHRYQLADRAGDANMGVNPWRQLDTPNTAARLNTLYPDNPGNGTLMDRLALEKQMARNTTGILGGSQTAGRQVADQAFSAAAADHVSSAADYADAAVGGPVALGAKVLFGAVRKRAQQRADDTATNIADQLAPVMFDPSTADQTISDLIAKQQAYQAFVKSSRPKLGGMFGNATSRYLTGGY